MSKVKEFYNKFSKFYDLIAFEKYYRNAREDAIRRLNIKKGQTILNVACGTGQNFKYFQQYLDKTGLIIGLDYSEGMLSKAENKIQKNNWTNIELVYGNAEDLSIQYLKEKMSKINNNLKVDAVICDLGLTAMKNWKKVINNMLNVVKEEGRIVIMDWYMDELTLRGRFINWIGKADITRLTWKYFKTVCDNFEIDHNYNRGGVFVASGNKRTLNS